MVLSGEWGALKSWLLLDWAIHLAAGRDWLGFHVPQARRVLYIDEEMPERVLRRRLKRLGVAAQVPLDIPLQCMSRAGFHMTPLNVTTVEKFLESEKFDPEVIIVETLARVLEGEESHNPTIAQFWQQTDRFVRAGRSFVLAHHMTKPQVESAPGGQLHAQQVRHRIRGASDIPAGADVVFTVEQPTGANTGSPRSIIRAHKTREGRTPEKFIVELSDAGPHDKCTEYEHGCPAVMRRLQT